MTNNCVNCNAPIEYKDKDICKCEYCGSENTKPTTIPPNTQIININHINTAIFN
jgi:Zn finger protein HypA/HybF involved in hydrogenase expression